MGAKSEQNADANDLALVRRAQSGEIGPFDRLVCKYRHAVMQIAIRYVRDWDDAEDAAQETFLRAYRALGKFRGESTFYTWLCRIAMNSAATLFAVRSRHFATVSVRLADVDPSGEWSLESADSDTPEKWLLSDELCRCLTAAIEALPDGQRTALVLRDMRGLSYRQVAVTMGSPIGTVRSRLARARETIGRRLQSYE
jgi:RNA polymerase sigma-70 factor, ECF subfamily